MVPGPEMLFGLMLVAAIVGGHIANMVRVPRVVGFLLGGVALRAVLQVGLSSTQSENAGYTLESAAQPLRPIKDLALGLILFTIGSVFERSRLRAAGPRVWKISLLEVGLTLLFVFVVCLMIVLFIQPLTYSTDTVVLALLLAATAVATAPAATLFVLREYEAKGPITETVLGLTALNNIVCIVLFQSVFLILASLGVIQTTGSMAGHLGMALFFSTVGSVVLGVVLGSLISVVHGKLPLSETLLCFFALLVLLGAGEHWLWQHRGLSYNSLLTTLVIGATFYNVALDSEKLESAMQTFGWPIFASFFVMAGYQLHLSNLRNMGWLGLGYFAARFCGKWLGCRVGSRWAHGPARADGRLGGALLCQAAVAIGLVSFIEQYWQSELSTQYATAILGSIVLCELLGPLLVKHCVIQAGEVKAITLLRRTDTPGEIGSMVRQVTTALMKLVGLRIGRADQEPGAMCVEHIMRTNVQFIPASATFDEVLHRIEQSTYSHFPVVDEGGEFVGLIHFSDVHDVIYDPTLTDLVTAVDLADADAVTVPVGTPLGELLDLFVEHDVSVMPVVQQVKSRRIIGLVEQRDLLRAAHTRKETD